jgi:hypothetical protein
MTSQDSGSFPTFSRFIDSVTSARYEEYLTRSDAKVANEEHFAAMRQYIVDLYDRVEVTHSFADENGEIFDCIPIEHQPSLKGTSVRPSDDAPEPPPSPKSTDGNKQEVPIEAQLGHDRTDKFGHIMSCPSGTIAMRRITLEELTRHKTFQDFFRKFPADKGHHQRLGSPDMDPAVHKHAVAIQEIDNLGGRSAINVWGGDNYCVAPDLQASISQQWYFGGEPIQSVECGWQVYPGKYTHNHTVLFIFWTADGYQEKMGYNLDSPAFIQTSPNWALGGTLPTSVRDGIQYVLKTVWYLADGKWWLYLTRRVGDQPVEDAVGYYPVSLFEGGQLASYAKYIEYGGEVAGIAAWPPMGSGTSPTTGSFSDDFGRVAYQRDICYFPAGGGGAQYASPMANDTSPNCFTSIVKFTSAPWNRYMWFGGPGGTHCT